MAAVIRYFAPLMALLILATSPAYGEEGVLVPGDPPLTQEMAGGVTGFYEWLLDAQMTREQRWEVRRSLVDSWQRRAPGEMGDALEILKLQTDLMSVGDARRGQVRDLLQTEVLGRARRQPEDEAFRWLLGIYESAHPAERIEPPSADAGGYASPVEGISSSSDWSAAS